jgi:2-hydroxychromene-2-carboxylate isomerase
MTTIEYFYDLASPNCYLANKALPEVIARTGATVRYVPMLLGGVMKATNNKPPFVVYAEVKPKLAHGQVDMARFIRKHSLTAFKMNPHFPLNTLLLQRGATAAQQGGTIDEYIQAAERLVWEQGLKMDDPEVFVQGLTEAGLDGAALLARTQDPAVKEQLKSNTEEAIARGCFGAPTFFVGEEMFFGKDRLGDLEDEVERVA